MAAYGEESSGRGSLREKSLQRRRIAKEHNSNFRAGYVQIDEQHLHRSGIRGRKLCCFVFVVAIMFIIIIANLIVTILLMSVLRIYPYVGMEGLEFLQSPRRILAFADHADLGNIVPHDNILAGYSDNAVKFTAIKDQQLVVGATSYGIPKDKRKISREVSYCESERRATNRSVGNKTRSLGLPDCDVSGYYVKEQCEPAGNLAGKCWCVDEETGVAVNYSEAANQCPTRKEKLGVSGVHVTPESVTVRNFRSIRFVEPATGVAYFTPSEPFSHLSDAGGDLTLSGDGQGANITLTGLKRLVSDTVYANKVSSRSPSPLAVESSETLELQGSEGVMLEGKRISISAQTGITLRSAEGVVLLDSRKGSIYLPKVQTSRPAPKTFPHYKVCMCATNGQLFLVSPDNRCDNVDADPCV